MTKPKKIGGIGVPHIFRYYMASVHRNPTMPWLEIENTSLTPMTMDQIIWIPGKDRDIPDHLPPITMHSLQTWDKFREKLHLSPCNSIFCTFLRNKKFPPGMETRDFLPWIDNKTHLCSTLVTEREIHTFSDLKDNFQIPNGQFFRYLQIRHFVTQTFLQDQNAHLISIIYNRFAEHNTTLAQPYMTKWEGDLQETTEKEQWQTIWDKAERGTFYHMWWTCKIVREFWKMVAHTLSAIFKLSIEPNPLSFLLALPLTTLKTSDSNKLVLIYQSMIM
ncbi:hypothetical protein XELAEV_18008013mg [Xenopus laevis]|uniref:Uncharacterized protein n=1 Tax=Xenopus laevis TaxID=8355 RepID=A0A974E3F4_XENLA|nr:hypothetical protein XELAEV_18008013mg [Xenopus laevis]